MAVKRSTARGLSNTTNQVNVDRATLWKVYIVTLLVLVGGFGYYHYYTTQQLKADYSFQIEMLSQALLESNARHSANAQVLNANIMNVSTALRDQGDLLVEMIGSVRDEQNQKLQQAVQDNQRALDQLESDLEEDIRNVELTSSDFSGIVDDVLHSVVSVLTDVGQGSGAFITDDGHIITNAHVVVGARVIQVLTYDGRRHSATLVGQDATADIAVLLAFNVTYDALRFADNDDVRVGEKVIALGNPGGFDFSVTEGIVSAVGRTASNGYEYVQTDVSINPGNSGGPLVSTRGRIVGINTFKISGFEGTGFALNSDDARRISERFT